MRHLLSLLILLAPFQAPAAERAQVDVLLLLAVDVSISVDDEEYALQREGLARALEDPAVADILAQCNGRGAGLSYMEWTSGDVRYASVDRIAWRLVRTPADLAALAGELRGFSSRVYANSTDLAQALRFARNAFARAPWDAGRKIISMSGDGPQNVYPNRAYKLSGANKLEYLRDERDRVLAEGIRIDALAITNDQNTGLKNQSLTEYFAENLVGGPGYVLSEAADYAAFAEAFKRTLMRELDNCAF